MDFLTARSSPDDPTQAYLELIEASLSFGFEKGNVTPIRKPHTTGLRSLPCLLLAHIEPGTMDLRVSGRRLASTDRSGTLCVPAGVEHRATLTTANGISTWVHVNFTLFGGLDLFSLLECPLVISGPASARIAEISRELISLKQGPGPGLLTGLRQRSLGFALLAEVLRGCRLRPDAAGRLQTTRRLAPALSYLQQHVPGGADLRALAEQLHLSHSRFRTWFFQTLGLPPGKYLQQLRLRKAQELLITTDLAVREIAVRVGCEDPYYFSRFFSQRTGLSPAAYRKQVTKAAL